MAHMTSLDRQGPRIASSKYWKHRITLDQDFVFFRSMFWSGTLQVLKKLLSLPRMPSKVLRFVDLDDTVLMRGLELDFDDGLRNLRWNNAIPYIYERWIVDWYIATFHIRTRALFDNYPEAIYWLDNDLGKEITLLTAGDFRLQYLKILANWLQIYPFIIVPEARMKMEAIIHHIFELWYIPWRIEFVDDRIAAFEWYDLHLSRVLDISVLWEAAIPHGYRVLVKPYSPRENWWQKVLH